MGHEIKPYSCLVTAEEISKVAGAYIKACVWIFIYIWLILVILDFNWCPGGLQEVAQSAVNHAL
jgi:hypothetical protein